METVFQNMYCEGSIYQNTDYQQTVVKVKINEKVTGGKVFFIAPSPADLITSYTGSGMPFPNKEIAFENTPNVGHVDVDATSQQPEIQIILQTPNTYYTDFDTVQLPSVNILYNNRNIKIILPHIQIRNRDLYNAPRERTYLEGSVVTQEELLRAR